MGVEGTAKVGAIGPCPPIAEGPGRVVLMMIGHINPSIVRLTLEGHDDPIELTWLHRLYSEDAAAWLPAGELRPGASLRTRTAPVRIESIEPTRPAQRVYNIHVQHTHCFYVANAGVLSHNTKTCRIHRHHADPKFLGGDPEQKLTLLDQANHADLHRNMYKHLDDYSDALGNTMRPKRGNSGAIIRGNFSRQERLNALSDFYHKYADKYPDAADDFFRMHPGM